MHTREQVNNVIIWKTNQAALVTMSYNRLRMIRCGIVHVVHKQWITKINLKLELDT